METKRLETLKQLADGVAAQFQGVLAMGTSAKVKVWCRETGTVTIEAEGETFVVPVTVVE